MQAGFRQCAKFGADPCRMIVYSGPRGDFLLNCGGLDQRHPIYVPDLPSLFALLREIIPILRTALWTASLEDLKMPREHADGATEKDPRRTRMEERITGPITVDVYSETGEHRAFARAASIPAAVEWLKPLCHLSPEKLMVRMEDRDHSGCWLYITPPDAPSNWYLSAAAERMRAQVERRKRVFASAYQ